MPAEMTPPCARPSAARRDWLRLAAAVALGRVLPAHAGQLRVGVSNDMPPYVFEAERRGLDIDIVLAACQRGGLDARPVMAPMERLPRMLADGDVEAIATTQAGLGDRYHFSAPYIEYHNWAVALASRKLDIRRIADLAGYSVSTFQRAREYLGPEFAAMAAANPQYREEARQVVRNNLLFLGRIDVVVGDRRIIEHYARQAKGQVDGSAPLRWYRLFPPTPYVAAFRHAADRDAFDRGLAILRRSGEYAAIHRRYERADAATTTGAVSPPL